MRLKSNPPKKIHNNSLLRKQLNYKKKHQTQKLFLNNKQITHLNLDQIKLSPNLIHLNLANNNIINYEQFTKITNPYALKSLILENNPISARVNYIYPFIFIFPNIQIIDYVKIIDQFENSFAYSAQTIKEKLKISQNQLGNLMFNFFCHKAVYFRQIMDKITSNQYSSQDFFQIITSLQSLRNKLLESYEILSQQSLSNKEFYEINFTFTTIIQQLLTNFEINNNLISKQKMIEPISNFWLEEILTMSAKDSQKYLFTNNLIDQIHLSSNQDSQIEFLSDFNNVKCYLYKMLVYEYQYSMNFRIINPEKSINQQASFCSSNNKNMKHSSNLNNFQTKFNSVDTNHTQKFYTNKSNQNNPNSFHKKGVLHFSLDINYLKVALQIIKNQLIEYVQKANLLMKYLKGKNQLKEAQQLAKVMMIKSKQRRSLNNSNNSESNFDMPLNLNFRKIKKSKTGNVLQLTFEPPKKIVSNQIEQNINQQKNSQKQNQKMQKSKIVNNDLAIRNHLNSYKDKIISNKCKKEQQEQQDSEEDSEQYQYYKQTPRLSEINQDNNDNDDIKKQLFLQFKRQNRRIESSQNDQKESQSSQIIWQNKYLAQSIYEKINTLILKITLQKIISYSKFKFEQQQSKKIRKQLLLKKIMKKHTLYKQTQLRIALMKWKQFVSILRVKQITQKIKNNDQNEKQRTLYKYKSIKDINTQYKKISKKYKLKK